MNPEQQTAITTKILEIQSKYGVDLDIGQFKAIAPSIAKSCPVTWGMQYRALKGEPYRFSIPESKRDDTKNWVAHRPFLAQMLGDQAKSKCYEKSRQCGASESSVTEVLWFLSQHDRTKAMYVFPTKQQMEDFANTRINEALSETLYMKNLQQKGDLDNVGAKKIGKSFLFMRSGQTSRLGEGVDADVLYIDEKDRMSDKVEAAFEQSLSSSRYGLIREFSTPTLPGVGIDKSFSKSSQNFWFVKCTSGHSQTLNFEDNIQQLRDLDQTDEYIPPGSYKYKCAHAGCVSEVNRWDGVWVPKHPDKGHDDAGYNISQLSCVWISADQVMRQLKKYKFMDIFYNYVLGLPYSSNDGLISEDALMRQLDATRTIPMIRRPEYAAVVAGIDWGYFNWMVVLGKRKDGKVEVAGLYVVQDSPDVLNTAKEFARILGGFNPNYIVADLGYGRDRNDYLLKAFPDRLYSCSYTSGTAKDKIFQPVWNEQGHRVSVDRTMHLRNMLEDVKQRKIWFPGNLEQYKTFFKHILNLALIHEEVEDPNSADLQIIEKIGKKGDDHYAHSFAYALLALHKLMDTGQFGYHFL